MESSVWFELPLSELSLQTLRTCGGDGSDTLMLVRALMWLVEVLRIRDLETR